MINYFNLLRLKLLTNRKYRVKIVKWANGEEKYFPQYRYCFLWFDWRGGYPKSSISYYSKGAAWSYIRDAKESYEDRIRKNLILVEQVEYEERKCCQDGSCSEFIKR